MERTIILVNPGINWMWFHFCRIHFENKTAKVIKSWRAHKFEDRGFYPRHSECTFYADILYRDVNIPLWMKDGRPGGFDGLRALYTMPPYVHIRNLGDFRIIK